jgi:hypothetical protein
MSSTDGMLDTDGSFPVKVGFPVFIITGILELGEEVLVSADIVGLVVVGVTKSEFGLRVGLGVPGNSAVGFNVLGGKVVGVGAAVGKVVGVV